MAVGLEPLKWSDIRTDLGRGPSTYVGDIVEHGFKMASACIVLLSPDDEARLREEYRSMDEPHEGLLLGQPRANVLFEAGMAMSSFPDRTILVTFGDVRPFTDIVGRHVVHLRPKRSGAEDLCVALLVANCRLSDDWRAKIKSIDFYDCLPPAPQIPKNNAFRFKSFPDNPATTLKEFVRIGKLVTHDVWMDHLNDMDFERWFDTTVGDSSLENLARSLRQGQNRNRRLLFDLIRNRYRF